MRSIRVSAEAVAVLERHQQAGESLSDTILRLGGQRRLSELAGILSKAQGERLRDAIESGRAASRRRREESLDPGER